MERVSRSYGDCYILSLFGEDKTLCRRISLQCNGMKACIFLPKHLLESYERYEADTAPMQSFWKSELDANEEEAQSVHGPTAR